MSIQRIHSSAPHRPAIVLASSAVLAAGSMFGLPLQERPLAKASGGMASNVGAGHEGESLSDGSRSRRSRSPDGQSTTRTPSSRSRFARRPGLLKDSRFDPGFDTGPQRGQTLWTGRNFTRENSFLAHLRRPGGPSGRARNELDRKSTRLNSSHSQISYAVFCLKKKKPIVLIAKF